MRIQLLSVLVLTGFLFMGCDSEEPIPAYVHIDDIEFEVRPGEGSSSNKITDAWFYTGGANGGLQGAYELPASFPVLETGEKQILVRGGIFISGLSSYRAVYPFYNFYIDTVQFEPNGDIFLEPKVQYFEGLTFAWMDDFEDPGVTLEETQSSDTILYRVTGSDAFEGNGAMAFYLDTNRFFFECQSSESYQLPRGQERYSFLELDYRCNNRFVVGLIAETPSEFVQIESVYVLPSEDWNKIYINLSNQVNEFQNALNYRVFIGAILEPGVENAEVYIDNIKLIY